MSGRGKAPLSRSFQSDPAGADPDDLEAFTVYGDVMMEPTERNEIGGVGTATMGPGSGVMDLQTVLGGASFDSASTIPIENMTSQLPVDRP